MQLLGGANILQVKVESGVPLSDFALLCSVGRAVELKSKLKLHRKQILEIDFNTGEHFKLAKSFTAARGGNPISTCLFQSLPFVYTSAIHVVMQKNQVWELIFIYFARWVVTGNSSLSSHMNLSSGWSFLVLLVYGGLSAATLAYNSFQVLKEPWVPLWRKEWQLALKLGGKWRYSYLNLDFGLTISLAFVNQYFIA